MQPYVSLDGFTRDELATLARHLAYAAARRQGEISWLRNSQSGPRVWRKQQKKPSHLAYVASPQLCRLIREQRFMSHLAQAVETARADSWRIDLSSVLNNAPQPFRDFLDNELYRIKLAVRYVEVAPFDKQTRQYLFRVLDIELRFFSRLLNHVKDQFSEDGTGRSEPGILCTLQATEEMRP